MSKIKAFFLGMREFRQPFTVACFPCENAYAKGRNLAHWLTFRRYKA